MPWRPVESWDFRCLRGLGGVRGRFEMDSWPVESFLARTLKLLQAFRMSRSSPWWTGCLVKCYIACRKRPRGPVCFASRRSRLSCRHERCLALGSDVNAGRAPQEVAGDRGGARGAGAAGEVLRLGAAALGLREATAAQGARGGHVDVAEESAGPCGGLGAPDVLRRRGGDERPAAELLLV